MKNRTSSNPINDLNEYNPMIGMQKNPLKLNSSLAESGKSVQEPGIDLAEILFITSYPPRECGIATYSQDLIRALNNKFSNSLSIKVCALESGNTDYEYPEEVKYVLKTSIPAEYEKLALKINNDEKVKIVFIQHEFGFYRLQEKAFLEFLYNLSKPIAIVFHTVLPNPDEQLKAKVKSIADICESIVVMTHTSSEILTKQYGVPDQKITVIPHGTHLVLHVSKKILKKKYELTGRNVVTTFGLLGPGKSIETTLEAMPAIIKSHPETMFLLIGKTHPEVVKEDGEKYREMLEQKVIEYKLQNNVRFVNKYLSLPDLLEYLQLTDIYVFTTNDPNQAVSGTFAYAMSTGCPIISTPIPHAKEILTKDTGIIFDFRNSQQLADGVLKLLNDNTLRKNMSINTLEKIVSTSWENSAAAHAVMFKDLAGGKIKLKYNMPEIKLDHLLAMTTDFAMIQFSKVNMPDIKTGYTIDDNARALVAMCMHYKLTHDKKDVEYIQRYVDFIEFCQQPAGDFLNYVDKDRKFTSQNSEVNLEDSNGRAIWALGYMVSLTYLLPTVIQKKAESILEKAKPTLSSVHSPRAMAFMIKGLCYYQSKRKIFDNQFLIGTFADRLAGMYNHEAKKDWLWFESYLTYANSVLPEAMLAAWKLTGKSEYKEIAIASFNFLLSNTFNENGIEVISNRSWLKKGETAAQFGEQPIDVAYTIMTLSRFYDELKVKDYLSKMEIAFNWFLGNNRLQQTVYNPCTGGCYDGLEETHANLNQGAESTLSYLMARLTVQKYRKASNPVKACQ